jgi:hypothetical protein
MYFSSGKPNGGIVAIIYSESVSIPSAVNKYASMGKDALGTAAIH